MKKYLKLIAPLALIALLVSWGVIQGRKADGLRVQLEEAKARIMDEENQKLTAQSEAHALKLRAKTPKALAKRIRHAVWDLNTAHPASPVADRVTVCVGVAGSGPKPWEDTVKRADDALYAAKNAVRNTVKRYSQVCQVPTKSHELRHISSHA